MPLGARFTPGAHYRGRSTNSPPWVSSRPRSLGRAGDRAAGPRCGVHPRPREDAVCVHHILRERGTAQAQLAQAAGTLRAARVFLYETLGELWEQTLAGEPPSLVQRADLLLAVAHATSSAAKVVEPAYNVAGTSGIYTRNPLERHFRDIQVLKQHGFASVNRYETVSQVYFGLAPEFAPVAL